MNMTAALEIRELNVSFNDFKVLKNLNLVIEEGEIVCIIGRNGSGKTTLLRSICGLQKVDSGKVIVAGNEVTSTPTSLRGIGMIFQRTLLMPQLDVAGNLGLGIPRTTPRVEVAGIIDNALEDLNLAGYQKRNINTLSGGEQQRISIMRALLAQPQFLLLDEPLVSQDSWAREKFGVSIRSLLKKRGVAALLVSHDAQEAKRISDRVIGIEEIQSTEEEE